MHRHGACDLACVKLDEAKLLETGRTVVSVDRDSLRRSEWPSVQAGVVACTGKCVSPPSRRTLLYPWVVSLTGPGQKPKDVGSAPLPEPKFSRCGDQTQLLKSSYQGWKIFYSGIQQLIHHWRAQLQQGTSEEFGKRKRSHESLRKVFDQRSGGLWPSGLSGSAPGHWSTATLCRWVLMASFSANEEALHQA